MVKIPVNTLLGAVLFLLSALPMLGQASEEERALYREAKAQIQKRHFDGIQDKLFALRDYPLHSYLEADLLRARLQDVSPRTVEVFLHSQKDSVVADKLINPWLQHLARQKDWNRFLTFYSPDTPNKTLRCHYIRALQHLDHPVAAKDEIATLWQTGYSLPSECDPILQVWLDEHPQREKLLWQRARLAMQTGQLSLAEYLLRKVPVDREIIDLLDHPQALADIGLTLPVNDDVRALVHSSLLLLVRQDYQLADRLWDPLHQRFAFNDDQQFAIRRQIGRYMIASNTPETSQWLARRDPDAEDEYLLEWRIKLALKADDWPRVSPLIERLPQETRATPQWTYWLARAHIAQGGEGVEKANADLHRLSKERGYYSFLAADYLDLSYSLRSREQRFPGLDKELLTSPDIQRALELHAVGEHYWANREWVRAAHGRSPAELASMAKLAKDHDWFHQGILTAIRAGQWDDLSLRFPLAFEQAFSRAANQRDLELQWLYAIARKESAFSTRAVSAVGARGVMQIMNYTARDLARELNWNYNGNLLYEADKNIAMGSFYLEQLLERFNGNRVLATAAYNAGPRAIEKVLERQERRLPFDIWVETLPLQETRDYVKGVMAFATVYSRQLGLKTPLVASNELFIGPSATLTAANEPVTEDMNPVSPIQ